MLWLNEIQMMRKGLIDVKDELYKSASGGDMSNRDKLKILFRETDRLSEEFLVTEEAILNSLNNGYIFWYGSYNLPSTKIRKPQKNLFDQMKDHQSEFIELQYSVSSLLTTESITL